MSKITWLGRAAFRIETHNKTIFIDPWIKGNPESPFQSYKNVEKADLVLVTHDHRDHGFKDAVRICRRTGATFVGIFELSIKARWKLVKKAVGSNIGGVITINDIEIYFAPALHSSTIAVPCGFIIKSPEEVIYHTGDTGFFSDMELLKKLYKIDLMLISICPAYMMGIKEAVWAVEKIKPKKVIPCHFDQKTDPKAIADEFKKSIGNIADVNILKINETVEM